MADLNKFSSIFWKVQHSHSRHQETTSNLLKITLKGMQIDDQQWTITRGSFVHKPMVKFSRYVPQTFCCCCCCKYLKLLMVSTKQFTRLLEFIKLYLNKINPFIFFKSLIYQSCTLAWIPSSFGSRSIRYIYVPLTSNLVFKFFFI